MPALDVDRFRSLLAALRDANDSSPSFALVQESQRRWAQANADLEDYRSRGPAGQRDVRHQHPDLVASFDRSVAELEQRLADADREVKRIEGLTTRASAQRNTLQRLVDDVRAWARDNSITLPSDGDVENLSGFSPTSVRIATPPVADHRSWP